MRPRFALTIILCLLSVSVTLPASAQGSDREQGNARFEFRDLWAGLVAGLMGYGLTIDPNDIVVEAGVPQDGGPPSLQHEAPAYGLTIDPND